MNGGFFMNREELKNKMWKLGVVPVIAIESPDVAVPMADALIQGGLPVAEITFRTEAAAEVIRTLKKERPELLLGAGTILSVENLVKAVECGALFGVSPGLNPAVANKAQELDFPFFPGVMTPSEIEGGLSYGTKVLKFFPSEANGGTKMLKAVSAPYAHLGVRFIPTGGINMGNLEEYIVMDQVLVVGGTWIAKKDAIAAGKWGDIQKNAADAVAVVRKHRG
jgi:2-dehydro-3-deoxyphosphogluconate aldolase/(4S)-4-hydroxy-2-oxoglutarate aldolase